MRYRELFGADGMNSEISEAPVSDEMKVQRFYHGTKTEGSAKSIMQNGLEPGAATQGRGHLAPVAGKVYLTPSLEYATIYALGGSIIGTKYFTERPGDIAKYGRYGFVFVVDGSDLSDVQPDEDSVGEWFSDQFSGPVYDETTRPWKRLGYRCKHSTELIRSFDQRLCLHSSEMAAKTLVFVWNAMTPNQRRQAVDGLLAAQAAGGKRALKKMPDDMKLWLMANGSHVAHHGVIRPAECWRIDKMRNGELAKDCSNFFEIAEKIPLAGRK